tara:strand:- start:87 stop:959 length:873 start_codon:yes stop_codon:yes gene_type:complete
MTGFGIANNNNKNFDIEFNFKSTNNRFFDCKIKLPSYLSSLEKDLYQITKESCVRGSIQIYCKIKMNNDNIKLPNINKKKLNKFYDSLKPINDKFNNTKFNLNISFDHLLNNLSDQISSELSDKDKKNVLSVFKTGLKDLLNSRLNEGKKIGKDIKLNIKVLKSLFKKINALQIKNKKSQFKNLKNRIANTLKEFKYKLDESSLYKELAIYSDKYDISEEIVRINCHLEQFDSYFKIEKYPGKKINFLCQELFREINTIGSKSNNDSISLLVVDFKTSLEKIREQVQNIL